MPRQTPKQFRKLDEQGFASIVIALILIIVLALFTIGFAQLARREQKSALDKQLATQAYYAAESGVNDMQKKLPELELSGNPAGPDNCQPGGPVTIGPDVNGVQYTCVLVNLKPPNLLFDNIQPETMRYIVSSTTATPSSITVSWGSADNHTSFPGNAGGGFTPLKDWNDANRPAVLQFSVTPLNDLGRENMMANTRNYYLYPTSTGNGSNDIIVAANCNISRGKYPCQATISGIPGGTGPYLFRIIGHYDPSHVSISGKDAAGAALGFDGQRQIDATGKAHEVLKRIQVRVPKKPSFDIPKDALDSGSTCKHFATDPLNGSQTVTLDGYPGVDLSACDLPSL